MDIQKLKDIISGPTYAMDIKLAAALAVETHRPETECLNVLREGFRRELEEMKGRNKAQWAMRESCRSVVVFIETAEEYAVTDLIGFIASHTPLCVWGVLVGQSLKERATV